MKHRRLGYALQITLLAAAYFATARLGLALGTVSGFAALAWAPTGIALAALLIGGYRLWPAILVAACAVNMVAGAPPAVALGIGIGNTLEALTAALLLKRYVHFEFAMERIRDVAGLVGVAGGLATVISATIGVASLWLGGIVHTQAVSATWLAWWVGDVIGALVVTPLVLVWYARVRALGWRRCWPRHAVEAAVDMVLLIGVGSLVFCGVGWSGTQPYVLLYLLFPVLIWISLRFGQIGSVNASFVSSLVAIAHTVLSFEPSRGFSLAHRLLLLQGFMGVSAITFMTLAAVVSERERTLYRQQRLAHRATMLAKQRAQLLKLNKTKDEFIMLVSHQLRTPATGVKQYLSMLLGDYAGKLTKDQRQLLMQAHQNNEQQIHIINDLLWVAQLDAGTVVLRKEAVDLKRLVTVLLEERSLLLSTYRQTITLKADKGRLAVQADREKLRMVIDNLLDNAGKYSPPGSELTVTLRKTPAGIAVAVTDPGVGIAKKDLPKLFKKFSRLYNPRTDAVGGSGLGLYLARELVHMHKGTLLVSSRLGEGSTFTITLPKE